jgi:capsular polysaccharide biosynthesis protein
MPLWRAVDPGDDWGTRAKPAGEAVSLVTALIWYWRLALLVIVTAVALGGLAGILLQPMPTAVAQIAVLDPRGNSVLRQGVTSEASFATYTEQRAVFAVSAGVLAQACDRLRERGLACGTDVLKEQVKSSVSDSGAMIDISASAGTGEDAVRIADAVVAAYRDLTSKDLQAQVAAQQKAVDTAIRSLTRAVPDGLPGSVTDNAAASTMAQLQARVANAAVDASSALDGTRFVVAAQVVPDRRINAFSRGAGIGAGIGLLVAVILGYALGERVPAPRNQRRHALSGPASAAARPSASGIRDRTMPGPGQSVGGPTPQTPAPEARPASAQPRPATVTRRTAMESQGVRSAVSGPMPSEAGGAAEADTPPQDSAWDPFADLLPDLLPEPDRVEGEGEADEATPHGDRSPREPVTLPSASGEDGV